MRWAERESCSNSLRESFLLGWLVRWMSMCVGVVFADALVVHHNTANMQVSEMLSTVAWHRSPRKRITVDVNMSNILLYVCLQNYNYSLMTVRWLPASVPTYFRNRNKSCVLRWTKTLNIAQCCLVFKLLCFQNLHWCSIGLYEP